MVENVLAPFALDNVRLMLRLANGDIATTLTIDSAEIQVPITPLDHDFTNDSCDNSTDDSTARVLILDASGRWLRAKPPADPCHSAKLLKVNDLHQLS